MGRKVISRNPCSAARLGWIWRLAAVAFLVSSIVRAQPPAVSDISLLKPLAGQVILLDFWASWCEPCRKSLPWMDELQKQYGHSGLVVIAVNLDRERALAEQFLQKTPVNLRIEYDPGGHLAQSFEVRAMPTSLLFDRNGAVRHRHQGFRVAQREAREQQIVQLIKESAP